MARAGRGADARAGALAENRAAALAQLVEARVFGDLSVPECAELLGVSPRTVDRRWAFAVKWLKERLGGDA